MICFSKLWRSRLIILLCGLLLFLILILALILIRLAFLLISFLAIAFLLVSFLAIVSYTGCLFTILYWQSTTNVVIIDNHLLTCFLMNSRRIVFNWLFLCSFRNVTAFNLRNVVYKANIHLTLNCLFILLLGVNILRLWGTPLWGKLRWGDVRIT